MSRILRKNIFKQAFNKMSYENLFDKKIIIWFFFSISSSNISIYFFK